MQDLGRPVVHRDVDDLGVEDLADLVADQVVHRLHVELGRESLLDAGDDRQLGRALVGLGQEAARLGEQPGILEGDAETRRERAQQALVGLAEGVPSRALEGDDADDPVAGEDRDAEPRLGDGCPEVIAPSPIALGGRTEPQRHFG